MQITVGSGGFISLEEFKDLFDIASVAFYELMDNQDGTIKVKFYDKDQNLIYIKETKNE